MCAVVVVVMNCTTSQTRANLVHAANVKGRERKKDDKKNQALGLSCRYSLEGGANIKYGQQYIIEAISLITTFGYCDFRGHNLEAKADFNPVVVIKPGLQLL